jgi:hypothetical protein
MPNNLRRTIILGNSIRIGLRRDIIEVLTKLPYLMPLAWRESALMPHWKFCRQLDNA